MIAFRPDIRIIGVDSLHTEGVNSVIRLHFNTGHTFIAPKVILDIIYMLNGQFTVEHITTKNYIQMNIDSKKVLDEFSSWGIIYELSTYSSNRYIQAKDKLLNYVIHFPKMSNINNIIAFLLQKMCIKTVFYENRSITQNDVNENIYFNFDDIGKNILSFMQDKNNIDTVYLSDSSFNTNNLNENTDIVVNPDRSSSWDINKKCIIINTWNYHKIHFDDFKVLNDKINVSDNIKKMTEEFILAIRSVDDMLYSVIGGVVF